MRLHDEGRSNPSIFFVVYALQILQSQPAPSYSPIQPNTEENKRHVLAGVAGSHHGRIMFETEQV